MNALILDPLFDVADRVVVITGGCGLIGREIVKHFTERGARVVIVDVPAAQPESFSFGQSVGHGATVHAADVSKAEEVRKLLANVLADYGRVDVLINNHQFKPAGFLEAKPETFPEELWDAVINVNLKGTFLTCRDFGNQMLLQGKGSIINFASTYGIVSSNPALYIGNSLGNPLAYTASKGGVVMLTKYLGAYWAARGVRVNAVTPHGVWNHHDEAFIERFSAMSPMKRLSRANEVVGAVLYLASDASSYVTGSNLLVEGGWTAW
jgi:NAD(P)-dependent dehydrogenase (short-subunit alcohol dehydrogenase family)